MCEVIDKDFKYIYGPVASWRLGISLGVDLVYSTEKVCNFNCIYCQLGDTPSFTIEPREYVDISEIAGELERISSIKKVDYITFSGRGEPTLAANLGQIIKLVKELRIAPVAVLTNAALIGRLDVRSNLLLADFVIAKLDAPSQELLEEINRPADIVRFDGIVRGIREFKSDFKGKFALQMMFVNKNKDYADRMAELAYSIRPDEVQINTPRRLCNINPLSKAEIDGIKQHFSNIKYISVYDGDIQSKEAIPLNYKKTLIRRGRCCPGGVCDGV